jgi:hypothetical protein
MDHALELLPADYWRWWITANTPETSDSSFVWEQFQAQVNADLADVLGNFVNRILKFTETRFEGVVPDGGEPGELELKLYADVSAKLAELTDCLEAIEMRKACQALRQLWVLGNQYLTEAAPWTAIKTDPVRAAVAVRTGLNLVALFARVSEPFIPFAAEKIAGGVGQQGTGVAADPAVAEVAHEFDHPLERLLAGEVELDLLAVDIDGRADGGQRIASVDGDDGVDGLAQVLERLNEDVVVGVVHLDVADQHVERRDRLAPELLELGVATSLGTGGLLLQVELADGRWPSITFGLL